MLKWVLGAPALADDQAEGDPEAEAEAEAADPMEPPLRTVLAWAIQELAEAQTALQASPPPPPDPAAGWERFAHDRLEWEVQAAVPLEVLYLAYARRCAAYREPVLPED